MRKAHHLGQICRSKSFFGIEVGELSEAVESDLGINDTGNLHEVRLGEVERFDKAVVPHRDLKLDLSELEVFSLGTGRIEHVHHLLGVLNGRSLRISNDLEGVGAVVVLLGLYGLLFIIGVFVDIVHPDKSRVSSLFGLVLADVGKVLYSVESVLAEEELVFVTVKLSDFKIVFVSIAEVDLHAVSGLGDSGLFPDHNFNERGTYATGDIVAELLVISVGAALSDRLRLNELGKIQTHDLSVERAFAVGCDIALR